MSLNWLDLLILAMISFSMLTGLMRGFVKEITAICIWGLAFWVAYHYFGSVASTLQPYISDTTLRRFIAFILILLGILLLGSVFNIFIGFMIKSSGLSGTDRILGAIFGLFRGIFIVSLLISMMQMTSIANVKEIKQSWFYPKFTPIVSKLQNLMSGLTSKIEVLDNENVNEE